MDSDRFDVLTRKLFAGSSRRGLLGGLAGGALGLVATRLPAVEARKKRKHKKGTKKAKPNAFGCLSVGQACKSDGQCCAGICKGQRGRQTCRAHGTGTCDPQAPGLCTGLVSGCNDGTNCLCLLTTAESTFCGNFSTNALLCTECTRDADCEALGLPPGSVCAPFSEGLCAETCETSTGCIAPCGLAIPAS